MGDDACIQPITEYNMIIFHLEILFCLVFFAVVEYGLLNLLYNEYSADVADCSVSSPQESRTSASAIRSELIDIA